MAEAWILGQLVAIGVNDPKKYPADPIKVMEMVGLRPKATKTTREELEELRRKYSPKD